MRRRDLLLSVTVAGASVLPGCADLRSSDDLETLHAVPEIKVESYSASDADTTATVTWNGKLSDAFTQLDEENVWQSADDHEYLLLQLEIENADVADTLYSTESITVQADGQEIQLTDLADPTETATELEADGTISGWMLFEVVEDVRELLIEADSIEMDTAIEFVYDGEMDFELEPA